MVGTSYHLGIAVSSCFFFGSPKASLPISISFWSGRKQAQKNLNYILQCKELVQKTGWPQRAKSVSPVNVWLSPNTLIGHIPLRFKDLKEKVWSSVFCWGPGQVTLRKELSGAQAKVFAGWLYVCVLFCLDFHLMISISEHLEFWKLVKIPFHSEKVWSIPQSHITHCCFSFRGHL